MFPFCHTYDGLYQLATMRRGNRIGSAPYSIDSNERKIGQQWTLDPTGNWATFKEDPDGDLTWDTKHTRAHNKANEITAIAGSSTHVAHDRAGNMIKCPKPGTWEAAYDLKYDAWNRLVEVKEGTTVLATYAYDGLNRRVKTTSGGTTRHFYYSAAWQVLEERLGTSPDMAAADRQFVWGLRYVDDLVLRNQYLSSSNEVLFAVQDANFNVAATVDDGATPAVVERFVYSPYGAVQIRTANFANPISSSEWEYRYAGYRFDTQTGLMQVRNRYLHPQLGRWVTRDPLESDNNLYLYCNGHPIIAVDPTGEFWSLVITAVFTAADTFQYATGRISGAEYATRMAVNAAAAAADVMTLGQGGGLGVRGAALATRGARAIATAERAARATSVTVVGANVTSKLAAGVKVTSGVLSTTNLVVGSANAAIGTVSIASQFVGCELDEAKSPVDVALDSVDLFRAGYGLYGGYRGANALADRLGTSYFGRGGVPTPSGGLLRRGATVYRVTGGESRTMGREGKPTYWTTVPPDVPRNFRAAIGLHPGNSGQYVAVGKVKSTTGVSVSPAEEGPTTPPGALMLPQVVMTETPRKIKLTGVYGANPAF
jgi:RHS repeat-associated protein